MTNSNSATPRTRRELREAEAKRPRPVVRKAKSPPAKLPVAGKPRKSFRARAASKLFSAVAMVFVSALAIGMSVPANAFLIDPLASAVVESTGAEKQIVQRLEVSSAAIGATPVRDTFTTTSYAELLRMKYGTRSYAYSTTGGAVRWPFPQAVKITDGFGERQSPCRGCSSYHKGIDMFPGAGAPIFAIADGVVVENAPSNGTFGNHVTIEHVVGGQVVESMYAHMQWDSSPLTPGMSILVGEFVGLVGSTGAVTAPHLHLEIHIDGVAVDPYAWLQANAV